MNSLFRFSRPSEQWTRCFVLAGRVNSALVGSMRNTKRMICETLCDFHSSIQYTNSEHFLRCLTFRLFPKYVHVASSTILSTQATPCQNRRVFRNQFQLWRGFHCESNLSFCVDNEKGTPAKPAGIFWRLQAAGWNLIITGKPLALKRNVQVVDLPWLLHDADYNRSERCKR